MEVRTLTDAGDYAQAEELWGHDAVKEFIDTAYDYVEVAYGRIVKYEYHGMFVKATILPFRSQYTMADRDFVEHINRHVQDSGARLLIYRNPAWVAGTTMERDIAVL